MLAQVLAQALAQAPAQGLSVKYDFQGYLRCAQPASVVSNGTPDSISISATEKNLGMKIEERRSGSSPPLARAGALERVEKRVTSEFASDDRARTQGRISVRCQLTVDTKPQASTTSVVSSAELS